LAVAADGLDATFADQGLPNVADYSTRMLSALVILNTLKAPEWRKSAEQAQAALETALPARVRNDPETLRRMKVERLYREAREAWYEQRVRVSSDLARIVTDPVPPWLIAPWEDRTKVLREAPAPIPIEERPVRRLPSGQYLLERPGAEPLFLRVDEDSARVA
jgi:hypothetical protein